MTTPPQITPGTEATQRADVLTPDIVIVGGGPSGLTAAAELAHRDAGAVLVLEREAEAGGIPRHSDHLGYGIRDRHTFMSGPRYAAALRDEAQAAGAIIMTTTMATDWAGPRSLNITSPSGRTRVDARAVILATGARERPRPARLIPGDRPLGIYTTGNLQNLAHLKHAKVGKRAVVIGSELVSWSAVMTLRHVGCHTALMTTEYPRSDSYLAFNGPGRIAFRTKVATRTRLVAIHGRPNVTAVDLEEIDTGRRYTVDCDTVILTGDWIPDNELARSAGLPIDPASKSPIVDTALATSTPGIFAVGNLLHPVDTADVAALDGKAVAQAVVDLLAGLTPSNRFVRLQVQRPLRWVAPGRYRIDTAPPRGRFLLWTDEYIRAPRITITQDGGTLTSRRLWWPAAPGRVFRVPSELLTGADPDRGPVIISVS